jgi:peptidoglycan/LPS O-acetylase OafA/YrhL
VAISSVFAMVALGIWGDLMSATIAQITAVVLTLLFLSCADSNCPLISGKTLVYLGNISYLLYLVHWPMLQIPRLYVGLPLSGLTISILLLFTLMLAALIHKIFESPIRYMPSLVNSLRKTAIAMTTSIVFTLTLLRMVQ